MNETKQTNKGTTMNYHSLYEEDVHGERKELKMFCGLERPMKKEFKILAESYTNVKEGSNFIFKNEGTGQEWILTTKWEKI